MIDVSDNTKPEILGAILENLVDQKSKVLDFKVTGPWSGPVKEAVLREIERDIKTVEEMLQRLSVEVS